MGGITFGVTNIYAVLDNSSSLSAAQASRNVGCPWAVWMSDDLDPYLGLVKRALHLIRKHSP